MNVTDVEVATSVDDAGVLHYESILNANADAGVVATTAFRVSFDRLLLPQSVNRQALCVQPSVAEVENYLGCDMTSLEPSYDPVVRQATFRQTAGNPGLMGGVLHTLTLYTAVLDTDNGLRAFDGTPLAATAPIEFTTLTYDEGHLPPFDVLPTNDHFCTPPPGCTDPATCPRDVRNILGGCAYAGCHAGNPDAAAEGMDLQSPAGLLATAINRAANETETGEAASTPQQNSLRFGRAMPILDPNVPGESYLLYKLLANHNTPLTVPFPGSAPGDDAPEVTRLRNAIVVGMPMPPDNGATAELRMGEIEWLSVWLLQGAPVTCPE